MLVLEYWSNVKQLYPFSSSPFFWGGLISLSQIIVNQRVQVLADNSGQMAELASAWKVQTAISRLGN